MAARWEILADIINDRGFKQVAEIGIATGATTSYLLNLCPQLERYVAVDVYLGHIRVMEKEHPNLDLLEMDSVQAAQQIEDGSLDLVFIDADHAYESVMADIIAWLHKVRPGGVICGHDYWQGHPHPLPAVDGVKEAVDKVFVAHHRSCYTQHICDTSVHKNCYVWITNI